MKKKQTNQFSATRWNKATREKLINWLTDSLNQGKPKSHTEISMFLDISYRTFVTWQKTFQDFDDIVTRHIEHKKNELINRACAGQIPSNVFSFLMKCNYGMMEQSTRESLDLKSRELDAKINSGNCNLAEPISITFDLKRGE